MLAHNVSAEIRRAISRGEFAPGQKLNEVALAERFGVSRNTLREAFAMLTSEGLCERIPNRGVFLATPSPEFVTDTFRARAAIEPAALLWGPDLDVDRLVELNAEARVAIEEEDDDLFIAVNQAFHHVVLRPWARKPWATLWTSSTRSSAWPPCPSWSGNRHLTAASLRSTSTSWS
ncbi:GntR family transcriptional regulator [Corynebacterium wankanglinii]|nr:GntR family transcriptional regulator [Corynebacterium wankanglinii]